MKNARAVKILIAANVAMFVLQLLTGDRLEYALGLWPLAPLQGHVYFHVWQIVTYAFLHSTDKQLFGTHLLFNMVGLWMFGAEIERYVGPWRLACAYFAAVITAALAQLIVPPLLHAPFAPVVGASGGVFGLLLVYALMFPQRKVVFLLLPIPMPAWVFATIYAAAELLLGVTGTLPEVAHFAHLGGLVGAGLVVMQWRWASARARKATR